MDLPTNKLNLIPYLAQIKDEIFFDKLENYILEREAKLNPELKPITVQELINKIKMSELDFEDAVQYFTAKDSSLIDYFITRNIKDYIKENNGVPILTPTQFLKQLTI